MFPLLSEFTIPCVWLASQTRGRLKRRIFAKELNVNLEPRFLHSALTVIKLYVLPHISRGSIPTNSPFYEFPERTSASRLSTGSFTKCSCKRLPERLHSTPVNKNKLWRFDYVIINIIRRKMLHRDLNALFIYIVPTENCHVISKSQKNHVRNKLITY